MMEFVNTVVVLQFPKRRDSFEDLSINFLRKSLYHGASLAASQPVLGYRNVNALSLPMWQACHFVCMGRKNNFRGKKLPRDVSRYSAGLRAGQSGF
jgi:hypothetical protein